MDDKRYREVAFRTLREVESLFDEVDVEDADIDGGGDVLTIRFKDASRCVVNTQSPVHQIWLAGAGRGWHFSWDEAEEKWMDDRGGGDELFAVLRRIAKDAAGIEL
jgi:CyaY protein